MKEFKTTYNYNKKRTGTTVNIQWKGTDVCLDFNCECGEYCHFDGYFAMAVKCPECKKVFELQPAVKAVEIDKSYSFFENAIILEKEQE